MKLRIGYLSTMYHTSHILKQLCWVEQHSGIEAAWHLFGTGPAMVEAFAADALDAGYVGLPPAMIGIGKGTPLQCIAGGHVEGTVMIGPEGLAAARSGDDIPAVLRQFENRRIGSPARGSIHDVIIRSLLQTCAVAGAEVVNYPWADLIPEALQAEEIHGAVGTPPLAVLAGRWYGQQIIIPPACLWPFNPSYGIVVRRELLRQRRLLEDFLSMHEQACNLIIDEPDTAARIVAGAVKVVDSAFVREVFAVSPRYCASLPRDYIEATMAFVPVLKDMGYLKTDLEQDEVFDLSLIETVHPAEQHYVRTEG